MRDADSLALSCTGGSWCMAVGYSAPRNSAPHALAERWNGSTWAIMPTPACPAGPGAR
jgi:hypothetical protein